MGVSNRWVRVKSHSTLVPSMARGCGLLTTTRKRAHTITEKKESQTPQSPAVPLGSLLERRAETTSTVSARDHRVISGILPNVRITACSRDAGSATNELSCTCRLKVSPARKPKKQSDDGAVAVLKNSRQLVCVFQDIEPPKFGSILRKSTKVLRQTHTTLRPAITRSQSTSS